MTRLRAGSMFTGTGALDEGVAAVPDPTGNLHVALALALAAQPSERDAPLLGRVYVLLRRPVPARVPRGGLHGALAAVLGVSASETEAQLIDRVYRLTGRDRAGRRPRARSAEPTLDLLAGADS